MKDLYGKTSGLFLAVLVGSACCLPAYGDMCSYNGNQAVQSDLADAQGRKAGVDTHLQKVKDMERSVQGNPSTTQQTLDTLSTAEAADLDAVKKLNQEIDADQACLKDANCTQVVHVINMTGHVVVSQGEYAQDAGAVCSLEPGEQLSTGNDGSADLVILDGRRTIHIGPNSVFKMPAASIIPHLLLDPENRLITAVAGVRG